MSLENSAMPDTNPQKLPLYCFVFFHKFLNHPSFFKSESKKVAEEVRDIWNEKHKNIMSEVFEVHEEKAESFIKKVKVKDLLNLDQEKEILVICEGL